MKKLTIDGNTAAITTCNFIVPYSINKKERDVKSGKVLIEGKITEIFVKYS